jgi:hypothetical protein
MNRTVVFGMVGCLALLFVAALAVGGGGYWYYTRTPDYSLRRIDDALKNHDAALFEKHVDVEAVCDAAVDALIASSDRDAPTDKWEAAGRGLENAIVGFLKPQIAASARREITRAIENGGDVNGRTYELSRGAARTLYMGDGKLALTDVEVREKDGRARPIRVEVMLRNQGGYWQVFKIENLDELIRDGRLSNLRK